MFAEMPNDDFAPEGSGDASLAAGAVTLVTLAAAFGLLALGWPYFWVAFPVGFGGAMPLAIGLARRRASDRGRSEDRGPRRSGRVDGRSPGRARFENEDTGPRPTAMRAGDDALASLKARYARGDLDDAEFEERVERLLERGGTETA